MTLAIDVAGLNKSFGDRRVVKDVALQIEQGHITGFLGPNGSGKTTSLRMLCGLLTPDPGASGQVLGLEFPREAAAIKRQTGYMTQRFSLYEDLTIEENLSFVARVYSLDRVAQRVDESLEKLGLQHRRKQLAGQLSGGWKQRMSLAAAVMHEPKLLLLDEPTAGVDPQARRDFWDQIHRFADGGMTVMVSTHYMDEAERCHDIAYIFNGDLIARGTGDELIAQSGLVTFEATGPRADKLTRELERAPGVEMVAPFGQTLHVSGTDRRKLEAAIQPYRRDPYEWREAERCHDIAYIFNGDLIARGTGDELIAQSGLITFEATGPRADKLTRELEQAPGVEMVAPFGQTLHVSGTDRRKLEAAIQPYRRDPYEWREAEPTLEDVFIHLMREHGARTVDEAA